MKPVQFSSRIRFMTQAEFRRLPALHTGRPTTSIHEEPIAVPRVDDPAAYTGGAIMCNAGGFHNKSVVKTFHLFPSNALENIETVRQSFTQHIRLLRQGREQFMRGLLTGGQAHHIQSAALFEKLRELLGEEKIPFSILWGQRCPHATMDLVCLAPADTWILSTYARGEDMPVRTVDDLKKYFKTIHIAEGDSLELEGETITGPWSWEGEA